MSLIYTNSTLAQTQYPPPNQDLSQANMNAQIPKDVQYKAKDAGNWKKLLKFYRIYDPFYDTWDMEEAELGNNRYYVELKMKHFTRGGDGEAMMLFKRRADKVRELQKMASYEILEFDEGIENQVLYTRRIASGVFELKPAFVMDNQFDPKIYFPPEKKVDPKTKTKDKEKPKPKVKEKAKAKVKAKPTTKSKPKSKKKSADTCDCCDKCSKANTTATPQMDADSWKLNGEAQI